ncbi:MAG: DUF692 family multinuclear iron-containing protein [bacterium]
MTMAVARFGLGFRPRYFGDLVDGPPRVDWLELVSENFMRVGGRTRQMLLRLAADYPLLLHGVSLSIAGSAPLDAAHLDALRELADAVEPQVVSDHLCWTSWRGHESHDLLPVAYTRAVLDHVAARVAHVQEHLGRRLCLENASAYVAFSAAEMDEADFLAALAARTGCGVLLDVNNLYVNAMNLGVDPQRYLERLAPEAVQYFHIAGHSTLPDVRIDTHDEPVPDPVWALYAQACARFPAAGTILERDERLPGFDDLIDELDRARALHAAAAPRPREAAGAVATVAVLDPSGDASPRDDGAWSATQARFFTSIVSVHDGVIASCAAAPVAAARGVRVYRDGYLVRLQRGLRENFPALAAVVGAGVFEALIAAYVAEHPPRGWAFGDLGAALPAFVAGHRFGAGVGVSLQALAELATFEHAELEVHDAADDGPALAPDALLAIAPDEWPALRIRCAAALRLLSGRFDVLETVESVERGDAVPPPPAERPVAYLLCRPAADVRRLRLDPAEAVVLVRLLSGARLGDACDGEAEQQAGATVLARLATLGLLRDLTG